jgi:hypothetical protein
MRRMNACKLLVPALLLASLPAVAADLTFDVLLKTAYRTDTDLAAEADREYARAVEIGESGFKQGTAKEFDAALDRAAVLGHVGAADLKCTMRSNEALGLVFMREGYAWCRIAAAYFKKSDPAKEQRLTGVVLSVTERLGPENKHLGEEYEQFTLRRMLDAARQPKKPAAH